MDTYNPNKLTAAPKKVDISLRQLADFDQTGGDRDRVDNVRDNQVLVSLSKFNRPKTFSFRYISDLLLGGNGITISTDKDGITTISNSGVRKIIAGTNITISPVTGIGDVTINSTGGAGGGLPVGGTAGQILTKVDATDYNATWQENYADWTSVVKHTVRNNGLAGTITKGTAVYVTGSNGTNMLVGRASNASEATSSKTMGLMQSDITTSGSNQTGFVVTEGLLSGLNTAGQTAGDPVWLGVNGALIYGLINKPYAPAHLVFIGIVTKISAGNGEIFVKVQNGFELNEIHDVDLITTTPINGHLLGFDGTLWVNKTVAGWLGFTPVPSTRNLTINGTTQDLSADRTFTIATGLTVGTTPITSGTIGRVLFEGTGNVLQQSANLFWDNTNLRLDVIGKISTQQATFPAFAANGSVMVGGSNVNDTAGVLLGVQIPYVSGAFGGHTIGYSNQTNPKWLIGISRNLPQENALVYYEDSAAASARLAIFPGGNVGINTTTDAGFKLDVSGTARVTGILRASGNYIQYGTNVNVGIGSTSNGGTFSNSGVGFLYATANMNATAIYGHNYYTGNFNATSGTQGAVSFQNAAFTPTSGNAVFNGFNLTFTLNQTGTANGITRGLYIAPTVTAATNFRALETTVGKVCLNTTSGNTLIGTTTDAGYKLDVNGTARVSGRTTTGSLLVGATLINVSAITEITSTTQGFLPPRMTTTQKLAIATPASGLVVYDTTVNALNFYNGTTWADGSQVLSGNSLYLFYNY
jgi:hypothetical protein